jgi:hypothetical protein
MITTIGNIESFIQNEYDQNNILSIDVNENTHTEDYQSIQRLILKGSPKGLYNKKTKQKMIEDIHYLLLLQQQWLQPLIVGCLNLVT